MCASNQTVQWGPQQRGACDLDFKPMTVIVIQAIFIFFILKILILSLYTINFLDLEVRSR